MPEMLERKLRMEAKKRFPNDQERQDNYVYGTMRRRMGWTPAEEKAHREKSKEMMKR